MHSQLDVDVAADLVEVSGAHSCLVIWEWFVPIALERVARILGSVSTFFLDSSQFWFVVHSVGPRLRVFSIVGASSWNIIPTEGRLIPKLIFF